MVARGGEAEFACFVFAYEEDGRGTVGEWGGVGRGDGAVFFIEGWAMAGTSGLRSLAEMCDRAWMRP